MFVLMIAYLLLCPEDQMVRKQGTRMEGHSSEDTEGILFNASFQVVYKTPSDKSCMVRAIACVMLQLKVIR